jgi:hypothetical protein
MAACPCKEGLRLMMYMEKIKPPPVPLTDEERSQVIQEAIESENRWVKDFIDRLAGIVRDLKR